ncbi:metallo-beta-lactamase family protein [Apiospora aurea]|uniref:Metallo-beta-lactamase family protein n=1 Tax=Apiospora aurea TaxID=335848 RepID=A0ABR1QNT3_9PEZI
MSAEGEPHYDPDRTGAWLVCTACGTQFPTADRQAVKTCFICDDPRQFTPQTGQAFTTLDGLRDSGHRNTFTPLFSRTSLPSSGDDEGGDGWAFTSIVTEPKVAIGQRAILIRTPRHGNVLWDCVTLLDEWTFIQIRALGGLSAIVISHPHYYSTHLEWARAFHCPVYLAAEDREWLAQTDEEHQVFVPEGTEELELELKPSTYDESGQPQQQLQQATPSGVKILKLGGHFPGSFVLLYRRRLLLADTLLTTPAGLGSWHADAVGSARHRPRGMNSYAFMWSIPNMIPLPPAELVRMWDILKKHEFRSTHGAFLHTDIVETEARMRRRVLDSMQIQIRHMGYGEHAFLKEAI